MTPQEKYKEISIAFSQFRYGYYPTGRDPEYLYEDWLLTEEGKRLTAEEPGQEEEVKWLRATIETQFEAYEALAKETAQDIKALKAQLDRFEGRLKTGTKK